MCSKHPMPTISPIQFHICLYLPSLNGNDYSAIRAIKLEMEFKSGANEDATNMLTSRLIPFQLRWNTHMIKQWKYSKEWN